MTASQEQATARTTTSTEAERAENDTTERASSQRGSQPILHVSNLGKSFGGVVAVDGASFDVEQGTITGLIGPNGAGKSTTFDLITGVQNADRGEIVFDGTAITNKRTEAIANRGLVRTFQIARDLSEMTVLENVMLAPPDQQGEALWRAVTPGARRKVNEQERALREEAWQTLEFFEIDHLAGEYAGTLSGGQRKLLEMARVFMTDPEMMLLDEPLAGVNPTLEEKLLDRIQTLRTRGMTFLLVEHDMNVIMNNCDPIIVMHQGEVLVEGTPTEIKEDERVIEAYLGGEVEQ